MKKLFLGATTALALALVAGAASAQTVTTTTTEVQRTGSIAITPEQRTIVREYVVREAPAPVTTTFDVQVGAAVPAEVELYSLPETVITEVPAYEPYRYTVVEDRTVIVDPATNQVIEIIE